MDANGPVLALAFLRLRIDPAQIHFLKFILEGYDGLAILSTIDRQQGLVEVKFPAELRGDLDALITHLSPRLGLLDFAV